MAHDAVFIYQERGAQGNVVRVSNAVSVHDVSSYVGYQRDSHRADAAFVDWGVAPGVVGELGIHRDSDHFHIPLAELVYAMRVRQDFGGTDKGEIQGIKEQYGIFASNLRMKIEGVIEGAIRQNSRFGEVGRRVCNKHCHLESPYSSRIPLSIGINITFIALFQFSFCAAARIHGKFSMTVKKKKSHVHKR
jgi:hypothetical protein